MKTGRPAREAEFNVNGQYENPEITWLLSNYLRSSDVKAKFLKLTFGLIAQEEILISE